MDFIDKIKIYLINIPIVGKIFTILIVFYAINETINKITLNRINPFEKLISLITGTSIKNGINNKKKYYKTLISDEYMAWEYSILKKIYNQHDFTKILDTEYHAICFESSIKTKYPFENIINEADLEIRELSEYKHSSKVQKEYNKIVGEQIKGGWVPGFMLKRLKLDGNKRMIGFEAFTGTYEQNVYTSHILEYELYKAYKSRKVDANRLDSTKILEMLPLRYDIHKGRTEEEVLSTGDGRYSLIGVQMLVLFRHHYDEKYHILYIKRSKDVASKPGFYQFVPSGGFEIFENKDAIEDTLVRPGLLKNNFSLEKAVFRELIEEVFGKNEFIQNKQGIPVDDILSNEYVLEIVEMIKKEEAYFEFLGSTIDLVGLRHEFSFILRIDNTNFSKIYKFIPNHESSNIDYCKISKIKERINKEKLNPGSAGLLYLAERNHLFKEVEDQ